MKMYTCAQIDCITTAISQAISDAKNIISQIERDLKERDGSPYSNLREQNASKKIERIQGNIVLLDMARDIIKSQETTETEESLRATLTRHAKWWAEHGCPEGEASHVCFLSSQKALADFMAKKEEEGSSSSS